MSPFFVKLIRRFLRNLKKRRINLTKKGDNHNYLSLAETCRAATYGLYVTRRH
jgi:hypothetical protein